MTPTPYSPSPPSSPPSSGKGSSGSGGSSGSHAPVIGKGNSNSTVGYDRGPTKRFDLTRPAQPEVKPANPGTPTSGKGGKGSLGAPKPKDAHSVTLTNWRDVRHNDPAGAHKIQVGTTLAGRAHQLAVSAAVGSIGGVLPSNFHGGLNLDNNWTCDPGGWHCWNSCSWWWGSCGWSWCWYPFYWAWYYPCWWWYTYPYYSVDYVYYPATTVVYANPETAYASGGAQQPASEPAGEGVAQNGKGAAAAQSSPLAIAAQRYLELGDRAFREGRYYDAVQFYAKAVEFAPDQGALYLVLADALFAAGDYHYGAYAVRRALELDPTLVDSRVDKHGFYPDPRQFDEQLSALEHYLASNPSDRDARLVLALNYLLGARPKDAVRTLEVALAAMSDDAAAQRVLERAHAAAAEEH